MNYFKQYFQSSKTKLSSEYSVGNVAVLPSPQCDTAVCTTPNQSRRIVKTADGLELVLCADDVRFIEVIQSMFDNLKNLNKESDSTVPYIVIPISIDSATMQRIIDWSRATKTDKSVKFNTFFRNLTIAEACLLIEASLFLETKELGETAAQWVAAKLEGKTSQQMAELLGRKYIGLQENEKRILDHYRSVTMKDRHSATDGY